MKYRNFSWPSTPRSDFVGCRLEMAKQPVPPAPQAARFLNSIADTRAADQRWRVDWRIPLVGLLGGALSAFAMCSEYGDGWKIGTIIVAILLASRSCGILNSAGQLSIRGTAMFTIGRSAEGT
jgi:hypothetical protein